MPRLVGRCDFQAEPFDDLAREPHLLDYLIILKKHQWLIISFWLTVVTVVTIATFKTTPMYVAAARVEVDREAQAMQPFPDSSSNRGPQRLKPNFQRALNGHE